MNSILVCDALSFSAVHLWMLLIEMTFVIKLIIVLRLIVQSVMSEVIKRYLVKRYHAIREQIVSVDDIVELKQDVRLALLFYKCTLLPDFQVQSWLQPEVMRSFVCGMCSC